MEEEDKGNKTTDIDKTKNMWWRLMDKNNRIKEQ